MVSPWYVLCMLAVHDFYGLQLGIKNPVLKMIFVSGVGSPSIDRGCLRQRPSEKQEVFYLCYSDCHRLRFFAAPYFIHLIMHRCKMSSLNLATAGATFQMRAFANLRWVILSVVIFGLPVFVVLFIPNAF